MKSWQEHIALRQAFPKSIQRHHPVCMQAKAHRRNRGTAPTRHATHYCQGLSMDFAFAGQRSKDQSRDQHFVGLRGETAYIHIVDHHTGLEVASARISKGAPTAWVKRWLHQNIPADLPKAKRYVMLDQGGCLLYTSPSPRDS